MLSILCDYSFISGIDLKNPRGVIIPVLQGRSQRPGKLTLQVIQVVRGRSRAQCSPGLRDSRACSWVSKQVYPALELKCRSNKWLLETVVMVLDPVAAEGVEVLWLHFPSRVHHITVASGVVTVLQLALLFVQLSEFTSPPPVTVLSPGSTGLLLCRQNTGWSCVVSQHPLCPLGLHETGMRSFLLPGTGFCH